MYGPPPVTALARRGTRRLALRRRRSYGYACGSYSGVCTHLDFAIFRDPGEKCGLGQRFAEHLQMQVFAGVRMTGCDLFVQFNA